MSPEDYKRLNQFFLAALELREEERAAFLDQNCGNDAELRRRIEAMLSADAETIHLIGLPVHSAAAELSSDEASELLSGRRLGHYLLNREIGRGGMGAVYLAHDEKLDRRVALKVLPARFTSDAERVRRFQREARAATALNHPNILTIFDIGQEEGLHYIATEFVEGRTLRSLIGSAEMSPGKAIDVAMQIAGALAAAHQVGIVHRDIKPENVMVRLDGYVKVLDFGLAKLTEQDLSRREGETDATKSSAFETRTGVILGTVAYMSPEQARGLEVDARSDIFSLGVVLYELLTGARPFDGATRNHTLVAILDAEPMPLSARWPEAPAALQTVLDRMLAKESAQRYDSSQSLQAALQATNEDLLVARQLERRQGGGALSTGAARARTTGALSLLDAGRARKAGVVALLACGLLLLGFGFWQWRARPARQPFLNPHLTQVSTTGAALGAALSRDGRYVAYVTHQPGKGTELRLRQLASGAESLRWTVGDDAAVWSIAFSPDSNYFYFVAEKDSQPVNGALYRLPLLGTQEPQAVRSGVGFFSSQLFSPDGREILQNRRAPDGRSQVFRVELASGKERVIVTLPPGQRYSDCDWAADDQSCACLLTDSTTPGRPLTGIIEQPLDGGPARTILKLQPQPLRHLSLLPERRGLLVNKQDEDTRLYHTCFVNYADGALRQITTDLIEDSKTHLTADGKTVLLNRFDRAAQIWIAPAHAPRQARPITRAIAKFESVVWLPDGRLLYADGQGDLWVIGADGTNARQLTIHAGVNSQPAVAGAYIVFTSTRSGRAEIWRMNADGGQLAQLTTSGGARPQATPDGQWVIYENGAGRQCALWKVPLNGGTPLPVAAPEARAAALSPDGQWVAYTTRSPATREERLHVRALDGGAVRYDLPVRAGGRLQWTPDGSGLWLILGHSSFRPVIEQARLDGGPVKEVFQHSSGFIFDFAYTPDGKRLAYIAGDIQMGMVLLTDTEP